MSFKLVTTFTAEQACLLPTAGHYRSYSANPVIIFFSAKLGEILL